MATKPTASAGRRKATPNTLRALKALTKTAKTAQRAGLEAKRLRCEELLALIARRKTEIVEAFYDVGEALGEILHKELYRGLKVASFEALLKARKVMGATQAYKLIKIVEKVPRDLALKVGQEKAFALISYTEATPTKDTVEGLLKSDAKIAGVRASKTTAKQVRDASQIERKKAPKTAAQREKIKAHHALATSLVTALKRLGVKLEARAVQERSDRVVFELSYEQLAGLSAVSDKPKASVRKGPTRKK